MHLSLLSDAYLSDTMDDAGPGCSPEDDFEGRHHFAALCRGLIVVLLVTVPIVLTLVSEAAPARPAPPTQAVALK